MIRVAVLFAALLVAPSFAPAAGATEGRQDADDKRIAALIVALDADDVSVREEAGRELCRIGEPALPALKTALKETTREEVRGSIPRITRLIRLEARRKAFKGGPAVNGLSAQTSVSVREDKSILVTVEILNTGRAAAAITAEICSDYASPMQSDSSSGSHGRFHVRQLSGPAAKQGYRSFG